MSDITEALTEDKPKLSPEDAERAVVKVIDDINLEYQKSLESLADAETDVQVVENDMFKMFVNLRKNKSDAAMNDYDDLFTSFIDKKQVVFVRQTSSFKLLQKLRASHSNYLINVINALKAQVTELSKEAHVAAPTDTLSAGSSSKLSSKAAL